MQTSPNSSRVPPSFGIGSKQSPSSIEGRSEGEDTSPKIPPRKRYSSSFGHRYVAAGGGGGSVGSAGSGERAESASFLGAPTDDDEISIFVQEIDARKPLNLQRQPPAPASTSTSTSAQEGPPTEPSSHTTDSMGSAGPILTREAEVDERLRHMHEMFRASLEGLGGGRRKGSSTSMGGGSSASAGGSARSSFIHGRGEGVGRAEEGTEIGTGIGSRGETSRLPLGRVRRMSANDVASSGGSAEVMGRMELDEEPRRRGR